MEKYNIILADPPWPYKDKCESGKRGAGHKYKIMGLPDILSTPVNDIAAENSFLFLWCTFPTMFEFAPLLFKGWGFKYKTAAFVWVKKNKKKDTPFMGMGNYTRQNAEVCLLGIRGRPKRISAAVRQIIYSPIREHSRKPDEIKDRIVELCGDLPRIELFARTRTPGWEVMGNETEKF